MWTTYRDVARDFFPKAEVIVDKFHVVKYANAGVEIVHKSLKDDLSDARRKGLKRDRYVLLKRKHDLVEKDLLILEAWLKAYPLLAQAYELKESFYEVWNAPDRKTAMEVYGDWLKRIPAELALAFKELTSAMTNWQREIFAYFDHPVTNAYTEALNGLIQVIWNTQHGSGILRSDTEELTENFSPRLSRKYSFEVIRAKILYDSGLVSTRRYYNFREHFFSYEMPLAPAAPPPIFDDRIIKLVGRDISTLTDQIIQGRLWSDSTH